MIVHVCAVYDRAAQLFITPFVVRHTSIAVRDFRTELTKPDSRMKANPEDFELWHIADFEDQSGTYHQVERERLMRAQDALTNGT